MIESQVLGDNVHSLVYTANDKKKYGIVIRRLSLTVSGSPVIGHGMICLC